MDFAYIKLGIVALLPAVASVFIYLFEKRRKKGKVRYIISQIVIGIIFGGLAVLGTEFGIPINGAMVNCRDGAVLAAGLMFGAPAGIIAGLIGGIERWIAVAWGVGAYTRVACSVSTAIAGIYSAALRKFMFENKKPGFLISFAIGVVMEVFHLTMVFITNMSDPVKAMDVVKACAAPMIIANGVSVLISAMLITLIAKDTVKEKGKNTVRISQTIQRWMLITVLLAFIVTSGFVFKLQDEIANAQTESLLSLAIDETSADINDASDKHLLEQTYKVAEEVKSKQIDDIAEELDVDEISIIDSKGIIVESTDPVFVGFDMSSGKQASEFLCLLNGKKEFVQSYGQITSDPTIMRKYAGVAYEDGFIQVGYDATGFQKYLSEQVKGITKNRHVGKTGSIIIFDKIMNVVSAPEGFTMEAVDRATLIYNMREQNKTFTTIIGNSKYYCEYQKAEGYYIVSLLPEEEALQMRNIAICINAFLEVLVFAVMFGLIYLLIKKVVVDRIKNINDSLARITGGNLNEKVDVRSSEEFVSLSDDINSTVETLKEYINEASARIDSELEFAQNIQKSALPAVTSAFSDRKDFDIYASMYTAKEVGGDFYDFYFTDSQILNFLIADVSGKGIPAAMFMMRAKTELKSLTESKHSLDQVFTIGNQALCEGNDAGMFVTAWQGRIDLENGVFSYVNAGHNPPLLRRSGGKFEYLKSRPGFVLAGMDCVKYKPQEIQLMPGDTIFLYTDGVTEATNSDNELYSEERLLETINSKEFSSMKELTDYIKEDVDMFVKDAPQFDDITMLAFEYKGQPTVPSVHFDKASFADIPAVTEFVEKELEKIDCPMKTVIQFSVVIDEIYSNIVRYGYDKEPGPVTVKLIHKVDSNTVCLSFIDEGIPYNPLTKEDPDVTLSAEERNIGGLGIYMVKKTMDNVIYKYEDGQNVLTVMKNL